MRNILAFLLGFTLVIGVNGTLSNCSNNSTNVGGIAAPGSQWVCYHCLGMNLGSDGSFIFPNSSGAVGYIYTGYNGNAANKTVTLTYTVAGSGTVLPSPASGTGAAQVRLFLWRKGDDLACSNVTEWFRWWSASAGSLTPGQHTISQTISEPGWTDCYAHSDSNQLSGTAANLLGIGFTFGAEFFGHGVYSTGSNTFTINSFTIQ